MTFAHLNTGDSVFLDANTLVYHYAADPNQGPPCHQLVNRIEHQDLLGFTSTHMLSEAAHRLMAIEAIKRFGWLHAGIARRLRANPADVQKLTDFRTAMEKVLTSRIQIITIAPPLIVAGAIVSQQTGLLTNDALIVAVLQANGLTKLASNDSDFDRVPGLTRYAPV